MAENQSPGPHTPGQATTTTLDILSDPVALAQAVAELLGLSDERELWMRYALGLARWMYQAGYADGRADLARALQRADPLDVIAQGECPACGAPAYTDRLGTYCTAGCAYWETFGQPHPADYKGREHAA